MRRRFRCVISGALLLSSLVIAALAADLVHLQIIPNLPASPAINESTMPSNGDVNPYGVAFVPAGFPSGGPLHPGDIAVSNFNDSGNAQGTGSTIVGITPGGSQNLFFQASSMLGLTTALGVLQRGFVLVGSVPSAGTCTQSGSQELGVGQGSLLILDHTANVIENLSNASLLNGPWDLTVVDQGESALVFVSNVLSGTVTRLELRIPNSGAGVIVQSMTQIASGYTIACNGGALVVGPTGLAFDSVHNVLYVASTGDNAIYAISDAATRSSDAGAGRIVYQDNVHLHGPLGLVLAPNGDLVSSQGDAVNGDTTQPSELVEFTPAGQFVAQVPVDNSGEQGGAFGLALNVGAKGIRLAAVDDIFNALEVWDLR